MAQTFNPISWETEIGRSLVAWSIRANSKTARDVTQRNPVLGKTYTHTHAQTHIHRHTHTRIWNISGPFLCSIIYSCIPQLPVMTHSGIKRFISGWLAFSFLHCKISVYTVSAPVFTLSLSYICSRARRSVFWLGSKCLSLLSEPLSLGLCQGGHNFLISFPVMF